VHGGIITYIVNPYKNAYEMIFGSDITGEAIIPIVKNNGGYISNLYGNEVKINGENELNEFIKLQKNKGFYPYVTDKEG